MEWDKVRKWMLVLVLAVDLLLAGNLAFQLIERSQLRYRAAEDAVAVARSRGVEISLEEVLRMPETMPAYTGRRSAQQEAQAAEGLLGEQAREEAPGGGVAIFRGETGEVSFRRGGSLEIELDWRESLPQGSACLGLLEEAGFPMKNCVLSEGEDRVELLQRQEGYPILNCRLLCTLGDGQLRVRGRWLLTEGMAAGGQSMSRAQMVLALCTALEDQRAPVLYSLRAGYYLQSRDAQSLTLEPVWEAETGEGTVVLSCLTGKQLNFY